jgi:integrase
MPKRDSKQYGVRKRGSKFVAKPYIPALGEHKWAGTFDTEQDAIDAGREIFERYRRLAPSKETVKTFAARWQRDYPRPKESTNRHYAGMAKIFVNQFGTKRLPDITRLDARRFAREHKGAALAVRAMFSDAMDENLIEVNPFSNLRIKGSRGRKDIEIPSRAEIDRLVEVAKAEHKHYDFWRMILFSTYSTMRPSEVFGLEWADVDTDAAEIHVRRQLYRRSATLPKNGRTRKITLPPPAAEALKDAPKYTPIRMLDETGKERLVNLIFRNKQGGPMSATSLHGAWSKVRSGAGKPEMDYYDLRHTGATYLLEMFRAAGEDGSYDVATQLGHTDEGVLVRDLYGHPSDDLSRERLKRLWDHNVEPLRPVEDDEEATG